MSLQGSLKHLHLADVIQLISVSGKTGKFNLKKENSVGQIYLKDGRYYIGNRTMLVIANMIYILKRITLGNRAQMPRN